MINLARVKAGIEKIASFSETSGREGVTRMTFSNEYKNACAYLIDIAESFGLAAYVDEFGNVFIVLPGEDASLGSVMVLSHIDSVKNGGRFDGVLGVVGGLEVLCSMVESDIIPRRTVILAAFAEEEGVSFRCPLAGSKFFTGYIDRKEMSVLKNDQGFSYSELVDSFIKHMQLPTIHSKKLMPDYSFELHIEQGPVLEKSGNNVGLVGCVNGSYNYKVLLFGEAGHAGTVPMSMRKDAMVASSEIITLIEKLAIDKGCVATVGFVDCKPNAANVIPGCVQLSIDIRSGIKEELACLDKNVYSIVAGVTGKRGVDFELSVTGFSDPVELSGKLSNIVEKSAFDEGVSFEHMTSGALHDIAMLSSMSESSLIFCPSRGGISHSPDEWTDYDDLLPSLKVLYNAVCEVSNKE